MTDPAPRILFLFSGAANRRRILAEVARGENADTALRGMNHLPGAGYLDVEETVRGMVPAWLYRLFPWQARSLVLLPRVRAYDAVIAQDDLPLGYAVSLMSRFARRKTRWICIAINTSILIRRHARHPVRRFLLATFWKSFTRIVCLSREQLEDLARVGIPRARLAFVPFGVDAAFYADVAGTGDGEFVVSVGRDLGRDYPTLLEAAEGSRHPFVIVAAHKNLPDGTPLPQNVTVRYNLPLAEVRDLYAQARLVVVASKEADALEGSDCSGQTVILDAMAAGRAVLATERAWMADYFTSDEIVTVPPGDPATLLAAIEDLWRDAGRRARLGAAARAKVQSAYNTKTFARALAQLADTP